jgi:hypothetical protein
VQQPPLHPNSRFTTTVSARVCHGLQSSKTPFLAWILSRHDLMPLLQTTYVLFAKHRQTIAKRIGPTVLRMSRRFLH